jgi:hypothetical protein
MRNIWKRETMYATGRLFSLSGAAFPDVCQMEERFDIILETEARL